MEHMARERAYRVSWLVQDIETINDNDEMESWRICNPTCWPQAEGSLAADFLENKFDMERALLLAKQCHRQVQSLHNQWVNRFWVMPGGNFPLSFGFVLSFPLVFLDLQQVSWKPFLGGSKRAAQDTCWKSVQDGKLPMPGKKTISHPLTEDPGRLGWCSWWSIPAYAHKWWTWLQANWLAARSPTVSWTWWAACLQLHLFLFWIDDTLILCWFHFRFRDALDHLFVKGNIFTTEGTYTKYMLDTLGSKPVLLIFRGKPLQLGGHGSMPAEMRKRVLARTFVYGNFPLRVGQENGPHEVPKHVAIFLFLWQLGGVHFLGPAKVENWNTWSIRNFVWV